MSLLLTGLLGFFTAMLIASIFGKLCSMTNDDENPREGIPNEFRFDLWLTSLVLVIIALLIAKLIIN